MIRGPAPSNTIGIFNSSQGFQDNLFDREVPQTDEYQRVTFFDRSNALGFSEDKLGRLAEINKTQLEQALRDMNSFARTDAGFNRQIFQKGSVNNKTRLNPIVNANDSSRRFSPQKIRTDKMSDLKL